MTIPSCLVVMYHYVRNLPQTPFPKIKALLTDDFKRQVASLQYRYEMATLESALAFWQGNYVPSRDLCLLTFDDGLKDHYTDVLPILVERKIQGLFFIITACLEEWTVASVHKNHFLMAALEFDIYQRAFLGRLTDLAPETDISVDNEQAQNTYRWDDPEVAAFKYLFNFGLSGALRDRIVNDLFREHSGDEPAFAKQLYLSWEQAKEMQQAGMVIGGHSHRHAPLATLTLDDQREDLKRCASILLHHLDEQWFWPFSYPHGKANTFNHHTVRFIKQNGFSCAFSTVPGESQRRDDVYSLRRVDTNSLKS